MLASLGKSKQVTSQMDIYVRQCRTRTLCWQLTYVLLLAGSRRGHNSRDPVHFGPPRHPPPPPPTATLDTPCNRSALHTSAAINRAHLQLGLAPLNATNMVPRPRQSMPAYRSRRRHKLGPRASHRNRKRQSASATPGLPDAPATLPNQTRCCESLLYVAKPRRW